MGLGHIGIAFLMEEQRRKNMSIRVDVESLDHSRLKKKGVGEQKREESVIEDFDSSRKIHWTVLTFIFVTVLHMFQSIPFGKNNVNNQ